MYILYSQVWFERALKAKTWLSHILKSSMNTVLFVNATIGFSENLFLVINYPLLLYLVFQLS